MERVQATLGPSPPPPAVGFREGGWDKNRLSGTLSQNWHQGPRIRLLFQTT
jgi:hypothetical protein